MPAEHRIPYLEAHKQVRKSGGLNLWFSRFASGTAAVVGHPYMFLLAVVVLVIWGASGPFFQGAEGQPPELNRVSPYFPGLTLGGGYLI